MRAEPASSVSVCLCACVWSCRSFDVDGDVEMRSRDRWGDPMAGKLSKRGGGGGDGFDLPPPVITEANRAMMEASGGGGRGERGGESVVGEGGGVCVCVHAFVFEGREGCPHEHL